MKVRVIGAIWVASIAFASAFVLAACSSGGGNSAPSAPASQTGTGSTPGGQTSVSPPTTAQEQK